MEVVGAPTANRGGWGDGGCGSGRTRGGRGSTLEAAGAMAASFRFTRIGRHVPGLGGEGGGQGPVSLAWCSTGLSGAVAHTMQRWGRDSRVCELLGAPKNQGHTLWAPWGTLGTLGFKKMQTSSSVISCTTTTFRHRNSLQCFNASRRLSPVQWHYAVRVKLQAMIGVPSMLGDGGDGGRDGGDGWDAHGEKNGLWRKERWGTPIRPLHSNRWAVWVETPPHSPTPKATQARGAELSKPGEITHISSPEILDFLFFWGGGAKMPSGSMYAITAAGGMCIHYGIPTTPSH